MLCENGKRVGAIRPPTLPPTRSIRVLPATMPPKTFAAIIIYLRVLSSSYYVADQLYNILLLYSARVCDVYYNVYNDYVVVLCCEMDSIYRGRRRICNTTIKIIMCLSSNAYRPSLIQPGYYRALMSRAHRR